MEDKPRSAKRSRLQIDTLPLPLEDLRLPLEDLPVHNAAPPPAEATSTPTGPSAHPDELEDQPDEDIANADGSEESGGLQWFSTDESEPDIGDGGTCGGIITPRGPVPGSTSGGGDVDGGTSGPGGGDVAGGDDVDGGTSGGGADDGGNAGGGGGVGVGGGNVDGGGCGGDGDVDGSPPVHVGADDQARPVAHAPAEPQLIRWHGFNISFAAGGAEGFGKYTAVCKYHKRYTGSACTRERAVLGPTAEYRREKLREMRQWCLNFIYFSHQRDHIRDQIAPELILPWEIQEDEGDILPPAPNPLLRDDEIDAHVLATSSTPEQSPPEGGAPGLGGAKRKRKRQRRAKPEAKKKAAKAQARKASKQSSGGSSDSSKSSSKSSSDSSSSSSSST